MANKTLNPAETELLIMVLADDLARAKSVEPAMQHRVAVQLYRSKLAKLLNKLDSRYKHYA